MYTSNIAVMKKKLAIVALGAAVSLTTPLAAGAHVSVSPAEATHGGHATLTFKVPNEKSNASTTKVEINVPKDAGVTSIKVSGDTDWSYTVEKTPAQGTTPPVVTKVTFAAGGEDPIAPDQFREFKMSLGPLPATGEKILFPALQTYSDGEVVSWIEPPDDVNKPEHPAPFVKLVGDVDHVHDSSGHSIGGDTSASSTTTAVNASNDSDDKADDNGEDWAARAAIGVAIAAFVMALVAAVRKKR